MKLRMLAAAAALTTVMFAGSAFADGRIAECVSTQAPSRALTAVACKALAKEVGRVAAFGGETKSLDADDLTRCNASAKGGSALASAK